MFVHLTHLVRTSHKKLLIIIISYFKPILQCVSNLSQDFFFFFKLMLDYDKLIQ